MLVRSIYPAEKKRESAGKKEGERQLQRGGGNYTGKRRGKRELEKLKVSETELGKKRKWEKENMETGGNEKMLS